MESLELGGSFLELNTAKAIAESEEHVKLRAKDRSRGSSLSCKIRSSNRLGGLFFLFRGAGILPLPGREQVS